MLLTAIEQVGTIADRPLLAAESKLRRRVLIYAGLLMSLGGLLWGGISFAFGLYLPGLVPFGYVAATAVNFSILARTKNFAPARTAQIALSLLLPFIFQWMLGGFIPSGAMMLWSLLCLVGTFALEDARHAARWFIAFLLLTVLSGLLEVRLATPAPIDSETYATVFYVINVIAISSMVFFLFFYFVRRREMAIEELAQKNEQLAASQQALIQAEKLAALGQLVAGVAHELNTPLGAISAAVGNMGGALDEVIVLLPQLAQEAEVDEFDSFLQIVRDATTTQPLATSREERAARRALRTKLEEAGIPDAVQAADSLVDMGIVEVKPVYDGALRSARSKDFVRLAFSLSSLLRNRSSIRTAAERASKIVFALKTYAHPGADDAYVEASLSENLETVLTLYQNHIKRGVTVERDFDDDTVIEGMHDQLNQVWTNLIHNALQAMDYSGTLHVSVKHRDQGIVVGVEDTGPGIPEEKQAHIFEPFYTTKGPGEGTGLGLSICADIVERHQGRIEVDSRPGRTRFFVWLPVKSARSREVAADA